MQIANGLNMKIPIDRSILVTFDLSKAFDMISHDKLLDTMLPNQLKRWLLVYMTGRQSHDEFRGVKSKRRLAKKDVVLSPIIFNLYNNNNFITNTRNRARPRTYSKLWSE